MDTDLPPWKPHTRQTQNFLLFASFTRRSNCPKCQLQQAVNHLWRLHIHTQILKCTFRLNLDKPILLLAVYQEVGIALNASPSKLGTLTFTRAVVQALCSPLAGFLAMHYDRGTVIGMGTLVWAAATLGVGLSTTYFQAMIGRAVTGVRRPSRVVVSRRDGMKLSGRLLVNGSSRRRDSQEFLVSFPIAKYRPTMELNFGL